ncbi:zinc finger protein 710 [Trichogramma pretiosum]|uniref:zinc finger protein 710 n=1 Tax=Trichogramma pretiosum TaxID=7493 RepID=UPI000C71A439|nr:zinc finger protein 710 [Trichogramma pretiosum]
MDANRQLVTLRTSQLTERKKLPRKVKSQSEKFKVHLKNDKSELHEPTRKINELISDEEKKKIESYYYLDPKYVDEKKVLKNITVNQKSFRCKLCKTTYPRLDKCQVHVWRHLNMLPYICRACDFKTLTVTSIRGHVRKFHLKLKPFKCSQCDKRYSVAVLLKEHMISHTNSQPYHCDHCDFACLNKRALVSHMSKHKTEKDILCDLCGKGFHSTKKMRVHRNTHEESNAIKCHICLSYVSSEEALRRHHINVHTRDYVCKICRKKCITRKALHNHVYQVHADGRHHCPMCPKVYKNGSMLQDHILKHQGIRQYKCKICSKDFAQRTHLTTHMAVHDAKRHKCPGCQKGFNRQDNMKVHTRNCVKFQANPNLAKLIISRKIKASKSCKSSIVNSYEPVNITIKVEPIIDADINIKIEPFDEVT